jgi:hypothetical protein
VQRSIVKLPTFTFSMSCPSSGHLKRNDGASQAMRKSTRAGSHTERPIAPDPSTTAHLQRERTTAP